MITKVRNILMLIGLCVLISCDKNDEVNIPAPTDITNITATPVVGGVVIKWDLPADGNVDYVQISFQKKDSTIKRVIGKEGDSILIDGLLNKIEYTFNVQSYNYGRFATRGGTIVATPAVRPERRGINSITEFEKLTVTPDMIETFTQETTEGPKENLLDGDRKTYWHTAWSSNVAPLPHWVSITFPEETEMSLVKYYFRNNTTVSGRPGQLGLETSADGATWDRVWESADLATGGANDVEYSVEFDKTYKSRFFKVMILKTPNGATYVALGDISFWKKNIITVDLEEKAEQEY